MKYKSILETIGNTPVLNISNIYPEASERNIEIWIKLERLNPGGSLKDRIALAMIENAEKNEWLKPGGTIIEPTSGNTGVGLALIAAIRKYKIILVMPEALSVERRQIMRAFGAEIEFTPREKGMKGAIAKANELVEQTPNSWMPMQFENQINPHIHEITTAKEIMNDFPDGIHYLVSGVGTGGHLTGCTRALKQRFPFLKAYAVEPIDSAVISGKQAGPHFIQGIGAGFIPAIFDTEQIESAIPVSHTDAFHFTREVCRNTGLFAGVSTGASLAAINILMPSFKSNSRVLTFCYDTGERYLSVSGLFDE